MTHNRSSSCRSEHEGRRHVTIPLCSTDCAWDRSNIGEGVVVDGAVAGQNTTHAHFLESKHSSSSCMRGLAGPPLVLLFHCCWFDPRLRVGEQAAI
jgi:hypothetical protein